MCWALAQELVPAVTLELELVTVLELELAKVLELELVRELAPLPHNKSSCTGRNSNKSCAPARESCRLGNELGQPG